MNKEICAYCLKPMGNSWHTVDAVSVHRYCQGRYRASKPCDPEQTKAGWEEEFDKEFVRSLGENVEPVFLDPNGSVGPIKQFIRSLLAKQKQEISGRINGKLTKFFFDLRFGKEHLGGGTVKVSIDDALKLEEEIKTIILDPTNGRKEGVWP